ncbi:hypothetical protein ONZ45_g4434 [Pleurotus djamor]|nr:hypothetical protein ONZ45_g4434 [Pleurotus djamor]
MSSPNDTADATVHPIIPVPPFPFPFYDSYEIDPQWQIKFTVIWASVLGLATLLALPAIFRSIHPKRLLAGLLGIRESRTTRSYTPVAMDCEVPPLSLGDGRQRNRVRGFFRALGSFAFVTPPKIGLNVSQIVLVAGYLGAVAYCIVMESPLVRHPNRAGFIALAQLPVVILFGTKNSILGLLLGPGNGYERLNFIHRWSGRGMFLAALTHGSLWIRNRVSWGRGIAGTHKTNTGLAALVFLFLISLTSLPIIRRLARRFFFVMHVISFTAFSVVIFYHTPFAGLWLYPPLLLYALDILLRFLRYRMKDATLIAVDERMTLMRVPDCDVGWEAGQHVQLRVFFSNRFMESHPLTIVTAPPSTSCLANEGIILAARVSGSWSRALNQYANQESQRASTPSVLTFNKDDGEMSAPEVPIRVMLDGPYGGCSIDLGKYETVMLIAGGSGITFTLAVYTLYGAYGLMTVWRGSRLS